MTFHIRGDLTRLDGSDGFVIPEDQTVNGSVGVSRANPIDINGDGFDDILLGNGTSDYAVVLFGDGTPPPSQVTLDDLDGSDGFRIEGGANSDVFPRSAAAGGDFNGDGVADLAFGGDRIFTAPSGDEPGEAFIVFGSDPAPAFSASEDADDVADVRFVGLDDQDLLGFSLAFANVNGDGFDDFIIGAPFAERNNDPNVRSSGEAFVVFGGAAVAGDIDLSQLDGGDGFKLTGVLEFEDAGFSVRNAGDFNDDGFEDIIIGGGSDGVRPGEGRGSHYVVFGAAGGFGAEIDLDTLDGADGFRLFTSDQVEEIGTSIAGNGDFNGDGVDDLVIGMPDGRAGGGKLGQLTVIFGTDDAQPAAVDVHTLDATEGFSVFGARVGDDFGLQVDFGQDFNGDGFDDIVISSPNALRANNFDERGRVDILFGRPDDPTGGAVRTIDQLQNNGTFRVDGPAVDSNLSRAKFVGDVNGDGNADISVTARSSSVQDNFIIFGGATLADGDAIATEGEATAINVFAGSTFAPLNQPITEIDGQAVQTGDQVTTAGGSTVRVVDALAGDIEFTSGPAFAPLGVGDSDTDTFTVSVGGFTDATFTITVEGADGDDVIFGTNASDILNGGEGDDQIIDDLGADQLNGEAGDDDLTGGRNNDTLDGGTGADVMRGGSGNDRYIVDDLNDQVIENANEGSDQVTANGAGTFILALNVETFNLLVDTDGNGNGQDNRINGGDGANTIRGGGGRDIIGGGDGADILIGQAGDDVLRGGLGLDDLRGGAGADVIFGGADADVIQGEDGDDVLLGEDGDDDLSGGLGGDRLDGGLGTDQLAGGDGDDFYVIEDALDVIAENVGEGTDTVLAGTNINALADNVENITAIGDGGRLLNGNGLDNRIIGGDGDDFINGLGGDNLLSGGLGDDVYVFEIGDTLIERVGAGEDTLLFDSDTASDGDVVANPNNVEEFLMGGARDVHVNGTAGAERIAGSSGDNILKGGAGDDLLQGGDGDDVLIGHGGLDVLDGGLGDDRIKAGRDGDRIVYNPGDGRDRVFDFGGNDVLDLSGFDFDFLTDVVPFIRETAGGEVFFNFGNGDVLKLVGFPLLFLDDNDFIL